MKSWFGDGITAFHLITLLVNRCSRSTLLTLPGTAEGVRVHVSVVSCTASMRWPPCTLSGLGAHRSVLAMKVEAGVGGKASQPKGCPLTSPLLLPPAAAEGDKE